MNKDKNTTHDELDQFIEAQEVIDEFERKEKAYRQRERDNSVRYWLDDENMSTYAQSHCINMFKTPLQILVQRHSHGLLNEALSQLSEEQLSRIYKRFYLCMSFVEIAKQENVDESAVRHCINRALKRLKALLEGTDISKQDFENHISTRYVRHSNVKRYRDMQDAASTAISLYGGGDVYE